MDIKQAFQNLVAGCSVAQENGKLSLDQAAAVVESIKVVAAVLFPEPKPEAAPPVAEA
jgi:hypothetical protein